MSFNCHLKRYHTHYCIITTSLSELTLTTSLTVSFTGNKMRTNLGSQNYWNGKENAKSTMTNVSTSINSSLKLSNAFISMKKTNGKSNRIRPHP